MSSWTESFVAYLEEFIGNESEASYGTSSLCAICFVAQRHCFFFPPFWPLRLLLSLRYKVSVYIKSTVLLNRLILC